MDAGFVRPLRADEVTLARQINADAFRRYLALIGRTPETAPNPYDRFDEAVGQGHAWVVELDGAIVGVALVSAKPDASWSIDTVGVLEAHGGAGLGRALMAAIEAEARARGVPLLRLITLEMAPRLWQFYQRLGFAVTRRGPPPHGKDSFTRVFMEKPLDR